MLVLFKELKKDHQQFSPFYRANDVLPKCLEAADSQNQTLVSCGPQKQFCYKNKTTTRL